MAQQPLIAVFGGTGFLGRRIVRRLAAKGARVRIVSRRPTLPGWAGEGHTLDLLAADIRDEAAVTRAVQGADGVVNAVSLYVETRELSFEAVHVEAAALLAATAQAAGARHFVQVSGLGVDAQSPSPYVRARTRGEDAVRAAFPAAVMLRPSVIFGDGDAFLSALEGVTRLPVIPLFGRGGTRLQPVLVEDVARAAARVLAGQAGEATVFELGGAEVRSYREIVEGLLRLRGRRRLLLPVPFVAWRAIAFFMKVLPSPPLTYDQVVLMEQDNVVGGDQAGFEELGIAPRGVLEWLAAHGD